MATSDDESEAETAPLAEEHSNRVTDELVVDDAAMPEVPEDAVQPMEEEADVPRPADPVPAPAMEADVVEMEIEAQLPFLLPAPVRSHMSY